GFATIADLRNQLERDRSPSIQLEELWELEDSLPFTIELRWGRKAPATCDILFRRKRPTGASSSQVVKFPGEPAAARPLHTYATNPLRQRFTGTLTAELKRDLANTLPEYMVPAHFVLLDSMPLSPNGKVDRKQLPAPDRKADAAGNYVAPRTPTEQILASIWAEVLRIEAIGIQDNFFDLGGHSLSATRVVARVRQAFAVDLPLRKLFETPTIAELANAIEDMKRTEMTEAPPMVRASREQQLPLSFAQQRLWFLDQMDPGNWLYNIPRAIRLSGKLYVSAMKSALNGLIQRHEILRTTYHTVDDHPVQIIAPKLEIDLPVLDLSTLPTSHREAKARDVVQKESAKGFALATDPMLRGLIIKLDEQDHVLFLNTHHIASDGWSTGVMMNDLAELYRAALENRASELPELNIQYADYACWQRNWLQGEVLAKQAAYWKSKLEGAPPVLSIPPDHSRPAVQDFSGSVFESVVPKSLVAGLRVLGRQQGTTMFMTMLAAFKTLLHHYTSQTDIVIGTDLANRATVETEALIGFFVNLLVLRTDLSGNPTFEELASRVREVSLNAYAHQDLPFDKLVEELSPERSLSHSPIVQVLFVQQNTPRAVDAMPGLKTSSFKLDVPAKFDVAAFVNEGENEATIRWVYNSSVFNQGTIARMAANYELLVRTIIVDPTLRLESLRELLAHHEKQHRGSEQKKFAEAGLEKLKKTRRKSIAEI
ncbi:MAG TPA: condensation domain-containing protein, partial [Terriglobales bacterium]